MSKAKIVKPNDSVVPTITEVEMPVDFLVNELKGNKLLDNQIKEMVRGFILEDKDIDKEIEKVVNKIEEQKIKVFLTKIGFGIWTIAMIVLGALLPVIINKIQGK
jgi:hypothetical protein